MLKRSLIAAFAIFALSAAAAASYQLLYLERTVAKFRHVNTGHELEPVLSGDPQTILLAGSDRRHGDKKAGIVPHSDTIMLMRIDPGKGIALMSIPRDLKVEIPGHGTSKINDAYTLGGPKLMIKTVKSVTGLRINHYVDVNFLGFEKAVNALGCVYIDVDRRYFNDNSGSPYGGGYAVINVKPGYQKLCGQRALEYARYRHTDTDIVRAGRQQDFLRQVREQLSTGKLISKTSKLIDIFARNTTSDIESAGALRRVLRLSLGVLDKPITQVKFHVDLGPSYVTATDSQLKTSVRKFLFVRSSGALATENRKAPNARRAKKKYSGRQPGRLLAVRARAGQARLSGHGIPAGLLPDQAGAGVRLHRRAAHVHDQGPRRQAPPRLQDGGLHRPARSVLRRDGNELGGPADPRDAVRDTHDRWQGVPAVLQRRSPADGGLEGERQVLLDLEHAAAEPLRQGDARHRALDAPVQALIVPSGACR